MRNDKMNGKGIFAILRSCNFYRLYEYDFGNRLCPPKTEKPICNLYNPFCMII